MKENFDEKISLNDLTKEKILDNYEYQKYLRKNQTLDTVQMFILSEQVKLVITNEICEKALNELTDDEKRIIYLKYFENKTLNQICSWMHLTKNEALSIHDNSLRKLKMYIEKYSKRYFKKGGDLNV